MSLVKQEAYREAEKERIKENLLEERYQYSKSLRMLDGVTDIRNGSYSLYDNTGICSVIRTYYITMITEIDKKLNI